MTRVVQSTHARLAAGVLVAALALTAVVGDTDRAAAVDSAETVYIADGRSFADALVGATVAAMNGAPILTVEGARAGDEIPQATSDELTRLSPTDIVVFGGPDAISDQVVNDLESFASGSVTRIAGSTRFDTAAEVAKALPDAVPEAQNAGTLDGEDSAHYLDRANHTGTQDPASIDPQGSGSGLDADRVDGIDSSQLQLPDTLPSGRTLKGGYAVEDESDGNDLYATGVSFPVPLSTSPAVSEVHFIPEGDTRPAECPGTVDDPEADPGHLCVYEGTGVGYDTASICDFDLSCNISSEVGFVVRLQDDSSAGFISSWGAWAVTAD